MVLRHLSFHTFTALFLNHAIILYFYYTLQLVEDLAYLEDVVSLKRHGIIASFGSLMITEHHARMSIES